MTRLAIALCAAAMAAPGGCWRGSRPDGTPAPPADPSAQAESLRRSRYLAEVEGQERRYQLRWQSGERGGEGMQVYCTVAEPDSAHALAAATRTVQANTAIEPLRIFSFARTDSGMVFALVPSDTRGVGGGGTVAVGRDGCARVLELGQ